MPSTNGRGPKRAILYARVSTEDQAEEGYSLPEQVRDLRRYAEAKGYVVLGEPVEDDGYSGRTMNRPGLALVRELAHDGAFDVLLVAKWNRLFRKGAYQDLFIAEMKVAGVDVISLDGQKNDTPAGKLFNRMMADFSEYQRDDLIETMQRGKRGRARSGKVVPGRTPYGFDYDPETGNYRVHLDRMRVVRDVFRWVGIEGRSLHEVTRILNVRGVPTPGQIPVRREGKPSGTGLWRHRAIRLMIWNDVYKPHTYEELEELVSPEVAATLERGELYGIQWYNRARYERTPDEEKAVHVTPNKREDWIAVPVPDAGIPREWVEAAREAIKDNRRPSANGDRVWELSSGILYCGGCGCRMTAHTTRDPKRGKSYPYYHCAKSRQFGEEVCPHRKFHGAGALEAAVWKEVSDTLKDPEQLREDLDAMIELERRDMRRDPDKEAKLWAEKLAEAERMRRGYQEQAAKGYMTLEELGAALEELEKTRETAERELEMLRNHQGYVRQLEEDRDTLLASLMQVAPEKLDGLTPEQRHQFYKILRLRVTFHPHGPLELSWAGSPGTMVAFGDDLDVCELDIASLSTTS